jgi:hypothetical protein
MTLYDDQDLGDARWPDGQPVIDCGQGKTPNEDAQDSTDALAFALFLALMITTTVAVAAAIVAGAFT